MASVSWDADVLPRVAAILEAIPDDAQDAANSKQQLRKQFEEIWERPPVDELEAVLRSRFTRDRARALCFAPSRNHEHVGFYSLLISDPPDGAPKEHPQRRVQVVSLALLYLLHVHEPAFGPDFCLGGGLVALANLVDNSNMMIRAQAMEALLVLTGAESLGWFDDPPSKAQLALHQSMLSLTRTRIISALMTNYESTFPGGGLLSLQLLGFFLSWLRYFYCKDRIIRVSPKIIQTLESWSERTDLAQQERDFARKLYDDFKRFPAPSPAPNADDEEKKDDQQQSVLDDDAALSVASQLVVPQNTSAETLSPAIKAQHLPSERSSEDATADVEAEVNKSLSLKSQGNAAFAEGQYRRAIELYDEALHAAQEDETNLPEERAKVLANRAAARMELHKQGKSGPEEDLMEACVGDCKNAIALSPAYFKAHFRLLQAFMQLERWDDLGVALDEARRVSNLDEMEEKALGDIERKINFRARANAQREKEFQETVSAFLRRFQELTPETLSTKTSRPQVTDSSEDEPRVQDRSTPKTTTCKHDFVPSKKSIGSTGKLRKATTAKRRGPLLTAVLKKAPAEEALELVLKHLSENSLVSAFADQLDEASFDAMLSVTHTLLPAQAEKAFALLDALTSVKRFSLNLMFLSASSRKQIDAAFAIMRSVPESSLADLDALQEKYAL
ncbi:Tetratricopeptide repeat protein 1 [Hondaea fermentalgiana]|uniref:Tetratricopeptide repeat protein 1 n=1 Tax=Hondaea fermentalgiana TaxID=2315210 RepID=A0A2R5G3M6_9STRA|nr:Tetratricopeptide repeat protein 1 [Hondaea fermentalgiana]|eukprot:GBG25622.1 Tetratricopeptide repeat protein 1 [Hondaea fermentalgiana]